jgi:predicted nucleic acid-binding protein
MPKNIYNIFVDTNVLIGYYVGNDADRRCLDYLYKMNGIRLFISALSIAQLVSVFQKRKSDEEIRRIVASLMAKFEVLSFTDMDVSDALSLSGTDIEDNIQYIISCKMNCALFITNNKKDYVGFFDIEVLLPSRVVSFIRIRR